MEIDKKDLTEFLATITSSLQSVIDEVKRLGALIETDEPQDEPQEPNDKPGRTVLIDELKNIKLKSGERIVVSGIARGNIKISNQNPEQRIILDFSNTTIMGGNLQIENCKNLAIHQPFVNMKSTENNAIKVSLSENIIIDQPNLIGGNNGIKLTQGSSQIFVYQGKSTGARTDGMSCHKAGTPCGDYNTFYDCESTGGEQGFDITSGQNHSIINCKSTGREGSLNIGHGASANIINFKTPNHRLSIKHCEFVNLVNINVGELRLSKQGSDNKLPANITLYNSPQPKINTKLPLSGIYTDKSEEEFVHPDQDYIDETINWIEENLR